MFSRYRSYTCYSEENGKLVPSIEPKEKVKDSTKENTNSKETESNENKKEVKDMETIKNRT